MKLSPENFDRLLKRLQRPGKYDPAVARVLSKPAPWDENTKPRRHSHL
jgi:uncharacterized protein (DUF1778 family)